MALRLDVQVVRGEIDNRVQGRVRGRVWLAGRDEPLLLDLEGDAWRDLAGCRLEFRNPKPVTIRRMPAVAADQGGIVGDMTASRKVRVPDPAATESGKRRKRGEEPPEHWANALYLEWFSQANGRVVIESADFVLKPSLPEWQMSVADERAQKEKNTHAMTAFLARLTDAVERGRRRAGDAQEERPGGMDEFGWEQALRESDAVSDKYGELLDKYGDSAESEDIIAHEMGWDRELEDATGEPREWLRAPAEVAAEVQAQGTTAGPDADPPEDQQHPLVEEASELAMGFWKWCDEHAMLDDDADEDVLEAMFQAQTLAAKLAGALNSHREASGTDGLVVAALKRALSYLDAALAATQRLTGKTPVPVPPERLQAFRAGLFAVREEMLRIMNAHRRLN